MDISFNSAFIDKRSCAKRVLKSILLLFAELNHPAIMTCLLIFEIQKPCDVQDTKKPQSIGFGAAIVSDVLKTKWS